MSNSEKIANVSQDIPDVPDNQVKDSRTPYFMRMGSQKFKPRTPETRHKKFYYLPKIFLTSYT